jgi:hypothetical protein
VGWIFGGIFASWDSIQKGLCFWQEKKRKLAIYVEGCVGEKEVREEALEGSQGACVRGCIFLCGYHEADFFIAIRFLSQKPFF